MSITTKILSNSLIGLVSVLPALLVMPAFAGDPYMAGDAFVFGDIVVDGTNGTLIDNMAMGGRRMTGDGVHNGYNNVFPNYSMYGSSIEVQTPTVKVQTPEGEVQTPTAGTNLLYVGPVSLTLGDLGEKAFRYNFQKDIDTDGVNDDIDIATYGANAANPIVWNEEFDPSGGPSPLLTKVASVTEDLVAAGQSVGGVYLYSRKGDGSKSGTLSLAKTNAQIDGATVNAKSISVAGNSKVDIVKQDTSVLNTAERFYTSAGDIANASGVTTLNATDTINIDGSQVNVGAGTTLALNSGNDAEDGTTFQNLASDTGALSVIDGSVTTSGKSLVFADNTSSSHGAGLYYKTTAGGVTSSVVLNSDSITFSNNTSDYSASSGGALFNSGGDVSILGDTSTFTENKTLGTGSKLYKRGGGAIANQSYESEAAANKVGLDATMVIGDANSVNSFTSNTSSMNGGAIMNRAVDTDGGASLTINGTTAFTGNSAAGKGGAIYNMRELLTFEPGEHVADVTINGVSNFANNTAGQTGGAIYNSGNMTIANSTFTGNRTTSINFATDAEVPTIDPAQGGAIYNSGSDVVWDWDSDAKFSYNGVLNISNTNFGLKEDVASGNQSLQGGAIANARANGLDGEVTLTNTNFYNNKAYADTDDSDGYRSSLGGAIWNQGVMTINGDTEFKGNTAEGYNVEGGAIYNRGTLTFNDEVLFDSNTSTDVHSGNGAFGGAISNDSGNLTFKNMATFTENKAISDSIGTFWKLVDGTPTQVQEPLQTKGGALYNTSGMVTFENGALFTGNEATYGGAIHNGSGTISLTDATFMNNIAELSGGAVYNQSGVVNINAANADVVFSGNKGNGGEPYDIFNGGTVNFDAVAGRTISLEGIQGTGGTMNKSGAGTLSVSEYIANQTVNVDAGELHLTTGEENLYKSHVYVADGATINTIDNLINDYMTGDGNNGVISLADGALIKGDIDFENGVADKYSSESGTVTYKLGNLIGAVGSGVKNIQVASNGTTVNKDAGFGWFNSVTGLTLESSGSADGMIKLTGLSGGISEAADASAVVNEIKYDVTADEALTASKSLQNNVVLSGDGTGASGKELELAGADLTATDGANVTINDLKLVGTGALNNAATAIMRINDSSVGIKLRNAGILYSDPTTYSDALINTGIANIAGDTFASTGSLENYNVANLSQDGANKVTFDAGATISGSGTTNLVSGQTIFNNTVNTNTVKVASGADFDGALSGGTLDTHNGTIDTITGSFGGGALVLDAKFAATNTATNSTIDTLGGNTGTIKELNILGTSYGDANTVSLGIGSATLDPNVQINGMNYYTKVEQNGTDLVFSDKLINESNLDAKLGAWANGNNIKQSSSMDHAADGTTYMSVGQALTALDTAIGDRLYVTNGGYAGTLLSDSQSVAASILAIANQTDVNTTDIAGKQAQLMNNAGTPAAISSTVLTSINMTPASASDTALVTEKAISTALSTKLDTATALTTYAALANDNTFVGSQSIVNNKDSVGVGTTAFTVSATDTDAANGGTNASAATFTVNSQGVSVFGGFTTDTLATTGDATVGGNLTTTGNATVHGNATIDGTLTAGQTTIAKSADYGGAGDVTAVSITATDTDAANGGANAKTTTFVVKASGATINGNEVLTSASTLDVSNITDGAITEAKLATAVQTKLSHAEDAYAAAVTNKTDDVTSGSSNLVTSGGVYTNAKNASYNTVATSNISANSTIGGAISNLDDAIGTTTTGNYVSNTQSVGVNLGALDTAVKANANTIGDVDYSDEAAVAGSFLSVGGGTGTTTVRGALDVLDTAVSTHETTLGNMNALTGAHVTSGASVASNLDQLSLAIDAATTGAVAQAATYTDQRIESIDKNLSAGVAGAVALSSVAVSGVERGEVSVGAGYGYFNGQSAAAFGAAMGLSNRWSVNAGAGISNSDVSFRAGTNYKFKLF